MTRAELIQKVAAEADIPLAAAEKVVTSIFAGMAETLVAGGRIEIRGFGSFENREYAGYEGRNPKSGLLVTVKPKKTPFFKTGKDLKEKIQAGSK